MPTIGVSVPIPEPWATQLQDYRTSIGDTMAATIPTHITLVPPTVVADDELDKIETHLQMAAADVPAFAVHLRGTGTFRPVSDVVFVQVARGIAACEQLEHGIRRGRWGTALTFPYHPHVTVAHHLDEAAMERAFEELASFEAVFDVTMFHLYVHDAADGWRRTDDFALQTTEG